jgi:signal transduction histidine kinase
MRGTKYATGGFRRITQLAPTVRLRFFGFILVLVGGTALVSWITRTAWNQLERLQREHAAVKGESFYLGVTLRGAIRSLNGHVLQYGLAPDSAIRDTFTKEAADLERLIQTNQLQLAEVAAMRLVRGMGASSDVELVRKIQKSYEQYLSRMAGVLAPDLPRPEDATFEEVYGAVQSASRELLSHCDQLVAVQREGFSAFLAETQDTLLDHKRLLQITLLVILGMAGMLAILVYRGMIAPLRRGLRQSTSIIERQEKLASLGILASGVAHEIRNPLTAIKFRLFSLKRSVPGLEGLDDATIIGNEINRLERIVRDFLRFARPSEPDLATVSVRKILEEVRELMRGGLERSAVVIRLEADAPAWVHADAQQLKQVLINLVQNAAEAIGRNGAITLGLRRGESELEGRTKPVAILYVADTGKGIAPEIEPRLFDPFFTTKEKGTGLGLAIAARIVEKHGGMLRYESEVKQGTTFEVVLPMVDHGATEDTTHRG